MTEDVVRDKAKEILKLNVISPDTQSGAGQITSFKNLDVNSNKKPDGWYLPPKNKNASAIILEAKCSDASLDDDRWKDEILRNCEIVFFDNEFQNFDPEYTGTPVYKNVLGILYNYESVRYFLFYVNADGNVVLGEEQNDYPKKLQDKEYYVGDGYDGGKIHAIPINKQEIYSATKAINDNLHFKFKIKNLYHRMIFTACALVVIGQDNSTFDGVKTYIQVKSRVKEALENFEADDDAKARKISEMLKVFESIESNAPSVPTESINGFVEKVKFIAQSINTHQWNGEDVMGIFFNEFNRYKKKSESGQVFTPEHIVSLMCKLLDINEKDRVLDAACGSGAFLTKAMCMMVNEVGGNKAKDAEYIKSNNLYGVEFDKEIHALACANMLIHKDGKTNLLLGDSQTKEVSDWIKKKNITKVLMNPPYEDKYGCMKIVANVLDSVPAGTPCAFILPDKKLEKKAKITKQILKKHTLEKIIKLPEKTFDAGVNPSVFIFITGKPMNYNEKVFACYIEEDGLERVKNQGRQDIKSRWPKQELEWIRIINKTRTHPTVQWVDPKQNLSYQMPEKKVVLYDEDFIKTLVDYQMFLDEIDVKELKESIANSVLYKGVEDDA